MKLHLSFFNHAIGSRSLVDLRLFLMDGLTAMGHDITFGERIEPDRHQIFVDYFPPDVGKKILDSGVRYSVIATEVPYKHPESGAFLFNGGRVDLDWLPRAVGFQRVAEKADFIMALDPRPETLAIYREFAPTSYLGVGYSKSLHDEMLRWVPEVDLDFAFSGVPTEYRINLLGKLSKKYSVGWIPGLLSFEQRNGMLRRSRCNLALKLDENWTLPSFTRLMSLIHAERPALADTTTIEYAPAQLVQQHPDIANLTFPLQLFDPKDALEALRTERPAELIVRQAWEGATR